jgi:hypothetical protein
MDFEEATDYFDIRIARVFVTFWMHWGGFPPLLISLMRKTILSKGTIWFNVGK